MNKKTTKIFVILAIITMLTPIVIAAPDEEIKYTDEVQDVLNDENEQVNRPDIDISQISAIKNGREVELKLKLAEGGLIKKSTYVHNYMYVINLITSKDDYYAFYMGLDLSSLTPEELEELQGANLSNGVLDSQGNAINVISCTGEGENELSIKFNLYNSYEKLIVLYASVTEITAEQEFTDYYEAEPLYPTIKSSYDTKVGNPLNFEATLENETDSNYNWLWVFDNSSLTLDGQNPSHTFNIADTYTGTLYVYDENGRLGFETFQVNVTGTSTNGNNNNNNQPGFELILVIAAVAIALLIFRKKKK